MGKRSRHLNIKYFFVTDLINRKQVSVKYCSTDGMLADYMSKPLTGGKFNKFRALIMNLPQSSHPRKQECVGGNTGSQSTIKVQRNRQKAATPGKQDIKWRNTKSPLQ